MKPDPAKLRQQHQEEQQSEALHQSGLRNGQDFASLEEMIRYDVEQTPVPPAIAERLNESLAREPKPRRSWWQRLFSGKTE